MGKGLPIEVTKSVFDEAMALSHSQTDRALTEKLLRAIREVWDYSIMNSMSSPKMQRIMDVLTDREKDLLFAITEAWREVESHRKTIHPKYQELLDVIKQKDKIIKSLKRPFNN